MKRNIRITALLLAALTILPLTACNASLPPENDDVTTADSGSISPDDPSTAQTPETTNAPETTAPPETTPPAAELRLPTKEKPDPSVTRLLSANLIRYSELKENPDQPLHVFDFTQEKYQTQHSKDIVKNHDVSFAWKCTQAQQTVKLPEEKQDLSQYTGLSMWYYVPEEYRGATFILYFNSDDPGNDGWDYYSFKLQPETTGWIYFSAPLTSATKNRNPWGWDHIDKVVLTATGWGQTNDPETTIHLETVTLHTNMAAANTSDLFLGDAVAFSLDGPRAVYDEDIIEISALDDTSVVFEENGTYWLPLSVFAAKHDEKADYTASTRVLNMSYKGKSYTYTGNKNTVTVDGKEEKLDFTVRVNGDSLFVPHTYAMKMFGYSELYTDTMGIVMLSNEKDPFNISEDLDALLNISYATRFTRPSGEEIMADMVDNLGGDVHPRIMLTEDDFTRLKGYAKTDKTFQNWVKTLETQYGTQSSEFKAAPVSYQLPDGVRLLEISRKAKNRIIPWCLLYRLTDEKAYAERVWKEVNALCNFKDWHPDHFLDTAEICYPMAIAYDWLYDYWTVERREKMESATLKMGIMPGLDKYEGRLFMWEDGNWTGVCNGGLSAAALAYANVYPEECSALIGYAIRNVERGMYTYAPDGGYQESLNYWAYGTEFLHIMIASLDSACGTNYGLYDSPGLAASSYFTAYLETEDFGWAFHDDHSDQLPNTHFLSWFAKKTGDPSINRLRRNSIDNKVRSVHFYDLMWYDPQNISDDVQLNLDAYYTEVGSVTMRDTWKNDALFVGLHGGSNAAHHGDLDIGNFVIGGAGYMFLTELGMDNYNIPGYFDSQQRWNYYRKRAEGQNTLVIGDVSYAKEDQSKDAVGTFKRVENNDTSSIAVLDMTSAYAQATDGQRGAMLTDNRTTVIVQDEMHLKTPEIVRWGVHTIGTVTVSEDGRSASIKRGNHILFCEIVSADASLTFSTAKAASYDPNYPKTSGENGGSGFNKLMIITPNKVTDFECAVVFKVIKSGEAAPNLGDIYTWTDIADWKLS
ncbi:MAG: hypothetical protein E7655_07040 [Ruminococcaceae bacterium]|nr:hypothetical protein [Oscillospiraceae bacterium]